MRNIVKTLIYALFLKDTSCVKDQMFSNTYIMKKSKSKYYNAFEVGESQNTFRIVIMEHYTILRVIYKI